MSKPYNSHAKIQDKLLWEAMEDVTEYAFENLPLPNGYIYEQWQKIPFDLIIQWHISNGYSEEDYLDQFHASESRGQERDIRFYEPRV